MARVLRAVPIPSFDGFLGSIRSVAVLVETTAMIASRTSGAENELAVLIAHQAMLYKRISGMAFGLA